MLRSVLAVVTGFLFIGALSTATGSVLRSMAPELFAGERLTDPVALVVSLAYVAVIAIAGCYLCARLAPHHPMRHALILGALGLAFNIFGSVSQWEYVPVWYHAVALALTMPYAWIGGALRERELHGRPAIAVT